MKKQLALLLALFIAKAVLAESVFDYRGAFKENRDSTAKITNYVLLEANSIVSFELEGINNKPCGDALVARLALSTNPEVVFCSETGLETIELKETGIYEITIVPNPRAKGEIKFVLHVNAKPVKELNKNEQNQKASSDENTENNENTENTESTAEASNGLSDTENIEEASNGLSDAESTAEDSNGLSDAESELDALVYGGITSYGAERQSGTQNSTPENALNNAEADNLKASFLQIEAEAEAEAQAQAEAEAQTEAEAEAQAEAEAEAQAQAQAQARAEAEAQAQARAQGTFSKVGVLSAQIKQDEPTTIKHKPARAFLLPTDFEAADFEAADSETADSEAAANSETALISEAAADSETALISETALNSEAADGLQANTEQATAFKAEAKTNEFNMASYLTQPPPPINNTNQTLLPANSSEAIKEGLSEQADSDGEISDEEFANAVAVEELQQNGKNDGEFLPSINLSLEQKETVSPLKTISKTAAFVYKGSIKLYTNQKEKLTAWPQSLCWGENGTLWVLDSQLRKAYCINTKGQKLLSFGQPTASWGGFGLPMSILEVNNNLYAADTLKHCIHVFNKTSGDFVLSLSSKEIKALSLPCSMCLRNGEIWVADRGANRILCFDSNSRFLGSFGAFEGVAIENPAAICSGLNSLYILEKNGELKQLNPMGKLEAKIQTNLVNAAAMVSDFWHTFWVCDQNTSRVLRINADAAVLTEILSPNILKKTWCPSAAAVRADGLVAVADAENKMVHFFVPQS